MGRNWKKWKENYKTYLTASGCDKKTRQIQAAVLLHSIGEEAKRNIELVKLNGRRKKQSR